MNINLTKKELLQLNLILMSHYLSYRKKYSSGNRPYLMDVRKLLRKTRNSLKTKGN